MFRNEDKIGIVCKTFDVSKLVMDMALLLFTVKRLFQQRLINTVPRSLALGSPGDNGGNMDDENSTVVSLRCPITYKRINLPARGSECRHIQVSLWENKP